MCFPHLREATEHALAKHLEGGATALGKRLAGFRNNKVILEAANNVRKYFDSPKGLGPTSVADFEGENETDAREILQRDAFEVMKTVIAEIDNAAARATQAAADVEGTEIR